MVIVVVVVIVLKSYLLIERSHFHQTIFLNSMSNSYYLNNCLLLYLCLRPTINMNDYGSNLIKTLSETIINMFRYRINK